MSAFPRDPEHFYRWVRQHHDPQAQPQDFVPRRVYGDYVEGLLRTATEYPANARLVRRQASVVGVDRRGDRLVVRLDDGTTNGATIVARAVVLATGAKAGTDWAPDGLAASGRLLDPWTDELPDGDLLLVGTGLTMVDVAISADRPGRLLHSVARHDAVPFPHVLPTTPPVPPPPGITRVHDLGELRAAVRAHVERTVAETGDWRAAIDGLRPVTAQLWRGLSEDDRRTFLTEDARAWDVRRHRMPPVTARRLADIDESGRWVRHTGTVVSATPTDDGVRVVLTDGTELTVAAVVNCTGPVGALAKDPLLAALTQTGLVRPGPSGMGIDTADDGRVLGVLPPTIPFYAIGTLRRGNLWETTAMPEIREQAYDVARSVWRALHGEVRRRPVDPYGLTLTTSRKAASAYNQALARLLRLQDGVEQGLESAVALDPGFAQAHTALALLGHEWGAVGSWRQALQAAHAAAAERNLDDRETSFLDAVTTRLRSDEETGAAALLRHIRLFPRDALAVSVAVPTVAFGGLTSGRQTAQLVEGLGRTYGDDWWYAGQLAFVRQDQERWGEAEEAGVVRPLGRAVVRPRRARPRPRLLRDRPAHRGSRLARRLDPQPRPGGQPPLALLVARGPARAHAVRRRRRPPTVRARAGAAAGDRLPGAGRQRRAAVALPRHRHLGGRAAQRRRSARRPPTGGCSTRPRRSRPCTPRWVWPPRATRSASRRCAPSRTPTTTRRSATWSRRCAGRCSRSSRASSPRRPTGSPPAPPHRCARRQRRPARGAGGHAGVRAGPLGPGRARRRGARPAAQPPDLPARRPSPRSPARRRRAAARPPGRLRG